MTAIDELAELRQQVQSLLDANAELHGDYLAAVKERDELRVAVGAAKASIKAIAALSSREMRGDVVAEIKYICRDFLANANQIVDGEIPEGCTPADARILREANHALAAENDDLRARVAAIESAQAKHKPDTEMLPAPTNSLPDWKECALRVGNSKYIAERVAGGGFGAEPDSLLANELHQFIYEYDDADPYKSAWFLHRLEKTINFVKAEAVRDAYRHVNDSVSMQFCNEEYSSGFGDAMDYVQAYVNQIEGGE